MAAAAERVAEAATGRNHSFTDDGSVCARVGGVSVGKGSVRRESR